MTREQTKEKALRLLEFRRHSENELRSKLRIAGGEEDDIEAAIDFCREYRFVDDELYAADLARDLSVLKKYGKHRIYMELKKRGIDEEFIDGALENIEDDEEELLKLVKKKLCGNFEKKNRDKAIRYFMYRGYEFQDIKDAIERLMTDEV